ncbi:pilus assembly protein FimV [Variovorax soli]|uniref:Pilus assembly protein FimV n=1 Tax=Variovorax soli TaxID=376815 RepID=A0ABU1NG54_9BURK|nr:pilus assembly protein FimV [Variovorax soli]
MSFDAAALALGRLNVQSALGEPLRAEIEVTEIAPGEADGLKVNIAPVDAFNAAGVPYNAVLADVRTSLQRRADGRYVVRLTTTRMLGEPFVDLLVEANWNSGRVVRDYTVLLDPPRSRTATAAAPIAPTAPQISAAPAPRSAAATEAPIRRAPAAPAAAVAAAPAAPAASERSVRTGSGSSSGEQQVTVQPGDTAGKIAGAYKSADVSLDQMLVALLRANPSAFIGGNVNRIKAGAVVDVPNASQAAAVPADEAKRTVTAQSRDFGDYRRRLAENAPASQVADADRQAKGKLQANVEDRNAANAAADKLRITQGGAGRQTEEQLARSRQAQESSTRVAELSKNIDELNKLQAASGTSPAAAAGSTAATAAPAPATAGTSATPAPTASAASPAAPALPAALAPAASATAGEPAAPGAAPTPAPEAAASAAVPAATAPAPAAAKAPAPAPAPGFLDELLANPLILAGAALIALMVGFLLYRVLGRKRREAGESVFLESRIPKDSFFGASGGESVDTKNRGNSVVSSLSYSPSQLDAGDVDPVAEADVYLAYGRDLQAEEILREALRVNPERTAIHLKLLEIHAKRRDLRAYEALASEVHKLTGGAGTDWNRVVEMGKELDPGNPLYESGGRNVTPAEAAAFAGTLAAATAAPAAVAPVPAPVVAAPPPAFVPSVAPLDFDLDLSKPAPLAPAASVGASLPPQIQVPSPAQPAQPVLRAAATNGSHSGPTVPSSKLDLHNDFDTAPGLLEPTTVRAPLTSDEDMTQPATLRAGLPGDSGFIEFDMSSMAGLRAPADTERGRLEPMAEESNESPHAIKLSLARELKALGDVEGARSLVEEVAAEASDEVKAEAKQLLGQLR